VILDLTFVNAARMMAAAAAASLRRPSTAALVFVLSVWTSQAFIIPLTTPSILPSSLVAMSLDDPAALWGLRITSALASYVGLVVFLDRPRGSFNLKDDQYEIKQSQVEGAGLGFYVTQDLAKGTVLGTYPGVCLPLSENLVKLQQYPQCESYVWRFTDSKYIIDPTDEFGEIQDECRGGNPNVPLSVEICTLLAHPVSTALARINEPPRGRDINVVTEENLADRSVAFVLERDVYASEELFMDYGLSYDRSAYGGTPSASDGGSEQS
jgi:hypothetical protein